MRKLFKESKLLIIGFLSIVGCATEEAIISPDIEDEKLVLESFVFEKKNNPHLSEDIVFEIKNDTVKGSLSNYFFNSIPTFSSNAKSVVIYNVEQSSEQTAVNFRNPITYTLKSTSGTTKKYFVDITWDDALAHIYIETEGGVPIDSKEEYVYARLEIDGQSKYEDRIFEFSDKARIKGRGNSTWGWPKKPYKIKLDSKETLLADNDPLSQLLPEKDWVLLADYQDGVHLLNNVAFTIGRMLELPYTNTIIPVELTLNGEYIGVYGLTEQIEVKTNRVNVGKTGLLLELDLYADEEWQFESASYNLPVMIKEPELESQAELNVIKNEWNAFEALVESQDFPNNNYLDYIDGASVAKYYIVYLLTYNGEINHPKSTYLHKAPDGKYVMGPIWDFDWSYAFGTGRQHFNNASSGVLWGEDNRSGTKFFKRIMTTDPTIKLLIKQYWSDFTTNHLQGLLNHIDDQSFVIKGAKARNIEIWNRGLVTDEQVMKQWIKDRVWYLNTYIGSL